MEPSLPGSFTGRDCPLNTRGPEKKRRANSARLGFFNS
jgi:hypothetical protein